MAKFKIRIEDIVVSAALGTKIPLNSLVAKTGGAEYEPDQFPGLVFRLKKPKSASLIFASGMVICTGTKSIEDADIAISRVVKKLKTYGINVPRSYDVQVQNMVAATKIDAKLELQEIAFSLERAEYDPDQFPGLIYHLTDPKATIILSSNGKIVCTGARNMDDIARALDDLKSSLEGLGIAVKPVGD